jgi:hypothetical protein
MNTMNQNQHKYWRAPLLAGAVSIALLSGCFNDKKEDSKPAARSSVTLSMELPDSLTGGRVAPVSAKMLAAAASGEPCAYRGSEDEDPFRNGYSMTRFMVSTEAAWTCIADLVMEITDAVPHDGAIHETEHDASAPNHDPDDPTHYSVTDDSDTQTTVRLYYGYLRSAPPTANSAPGFFVSWNDRGDGDIEGRLVIDGLVIADPDRKRDDPIAMRMDFNYTAEKKIGDMFLRFDDGNEWAEGLRIEVTEDLDANPLQQVFLARGLIEAKRQFVPTDGVDDLPHFRMYTVADQLGEGAAIAEFVDVALPLELNANTGNHLGNYVFSKTDKYFFDADQNQEQAWDWIYKTVTASEYRGSRTTPETGGTWLPFDPSLDMIRTALELDDDYFTGSKCAVVGDDCTVFLNAVILDGFAGQEKNQGSDPLDWRSSAIAAPIYLDTVYPNGVDWSGAFDPVFVPSR